MLDWYAAIVAAVSALSAGGGPEATASLAPASPGGASSDPASSEPASRAVAALAEQISSGLCRDSILAAARETLAEAEVIANAAVMMFGGIETTEGMIANAVLHLLDNPDQFAEVCSDPSLIPTAVEESLRLEPAAAVIDRYATRDAVLGGADIRHGDLVRVSIAGANRDPALFADPDRFDLHRPNLRAQLSFARGPHACIAMDLARLEARAAIRAVLDLPHLRTATPVTPTGLIFRKPTALPVIWDVA
jgi:cytochrome P450